MVAASAAVLAAVLVYSAFSHERAASRPVGEGELFAEDGSDARERFDSMSAEYNASEGVRHLRNELMIEAVSLVGPDGFISTSTSANLVGTGVTSPVLRYGLDAKILTALAQPIDSQISIDGVVEWQNGDILYEVIQPLEVGSLLLSYDITELLSRRARPAGVDTTTVQLLGAAAALLVITLALLVGRARVARDHRERFQEARTLQEHARQVEATNADLRLARESAVEALALAEERHRIRSEFVLMINHELRTPLTAMVTGAELLKTSDLGDDDRAALIGDMVADGRRLEGLISQMLDVARIENKGLSLTFDAHDELELCRTIAETHPRLQLAEAKESPDLLVWTHRPTLVQLVGSLADNAVTHGATTVRLECSTTMPIEPAVSVGEAPSDAIHFAVIDDGPGIDPEFLPRIFEKFEKRSFSSGTGLGLYLATIMAEALDASLTVATSPNGTTVVVSVPVATGHELEQVA